MENEVIELDEREGFSLRMEEVNSLQEYIQRRNTAMLVIMFTDLKGFTQLTEEKGEKFSNKVRTFHDQKMKKVIEEGGGGKIIKFIGDAVMAVFSEPTFAVDRALAIQREFREGVQTHPELSEISVRIGLHMGQVAVENSIQTDIFGRHVNRAARIEGLADGGQIYMTYPVFDSAKGWLAERPSLSWAQHGFYFLKGIADPIEIIEVYDARYEKPMAPKSGKRKGSLPPWSTLIGAFLLGIISVFGGQYLKEEVFVPAPVVYFYDLSTTNVAVNREYPVFLDKTGPQNNYLLQSPLEPGRHGIWFANNSDLFVHVFEVAPGENRISPRFQKFSMPDFQEEFSLLGDFPQEKSQSYEVTLFDGNWNESLHIFEIHLRLEEVSSVLLDGGEEGRLVKGLLRVNHPEGELEIPIDDIQSRENTHRRGERITAYDGRDYSLEYRWHFLRDALSVEVVGFYTRP